MNSVKVTVTAENGIHARPATELIKLIKLIKESAPTKVTLKANGKSTSGASMISLLTLGLKKGTELEIIAEGDNEAAVTERIATFVQELK